MSKKNQNIDHYNNIYSKIDVNEIVAKFQDFDIYFKELITYHTSWVSFYYDNFHKFLKNKKVLELGCGDCKNSAILSYLGAEVYSNDISQTSGEIIKSLNEKINFKKNITFIDGDFLDAQIDMNKFDLVVGKAFVHHLTNEEEEVFLNKISKVLKPDGRVRFVEPCVNSKVLDEIRWLIPTPGRPSKLQSEKFKVWKTNDPHPERDNSSNSYRKIGKKYFKNCDISYTGCIERFSRLMPLGNFRHNFRKHAFILEKYLPDFINMKFARAQIVDYWHPIK
jgi:SAM-dependent methyltransferase